MPTYPKKYNPVDVQIKQVIHNSDLIDTVYRVPVEKKINEVILNVKCQVEMKRRDKQEATMTGDQNDSTGQLVFTKKYYNANSLNIRKGDIIIRIPGRTVNYRIIEVRESGFLSGTNHLIICKFIEDPRTKNSI